MPIPLLIAIPTVALSLYGAYKGIKGAMDHSTAKDTNIDAAGLVEKAINSVNEHRESTNDVLNSYGDRKLRAFNGVIAEFIETFGRLKNVDIIKTPELEKLNLGAFDTVSLGELRNDYELLKSSGLGLGAGVGGGAAVAFGAYSGTMALATASTGTAISTLSGAAGANATLAWLGGGSLATGGGGMALGTMVLGGLVAGPALAIFGHIVGNKGEEALNVARSNLEQAKTIRDEAILIVEKLVAVSKVTSLAKNVLSKTSSRLRGAVLDLRKVIENEGADYPALSTKSQEAVFLAVKYAQLIKAMIDTPILDEYGNLVLSTEKSLKEVEKVLA